MLIYLVVNFLVDYYFFALVLLTNGLVDVLIFVLVDVLRNFLLNSFYLWFVHLFNVKKSFLSQQPAENWDIFQRTVRAKKQTLTTDNLTSLFQIQTISNHAKP